MNNPIKDQNCEYITNKIFKGTESYKYFSLDENVKSEDTKNVISQQDFVSVPKLDIEIAIEALCKSKEGKSIAVYSPFYETNYMPYPLIISAQELLFGYDSSSFLVIGGKREWQVVLKSAYCHGTIGNHSLLKYYSFSDIANLKFKDSGLTKRYSGKLVRWIFSGFFNSNLWSQLSDIALIVVDLVTGNPPKLDKEDIEAILLYASKGSIPAIFFLKSPLDKVAVYLSELGVEITHYSKELPKLNHFETAPIFNHHTQNDELSTFLTDYNLRSYKIDKNGIKKRIEIMVTTEECKLKKIYSKLLKLKISIKENDSNSYGSHVYYLGRKLFDAVMEFTGAVKTDFGSKFDWLTHPLGSARATFSDAIWNLSELSKDIASDLIETVDSIMREFETTPTPKGETLLDLLRSYDNGNKNPIVLGKNQALSEFIKSEFSESKYISTRIIIPPEHLDKAPNADILVMLNPVYGKDKVKLLTSCTNKIVLIIYPWQLKVTLKSIDEVRTLLCSNGKDLKSMPVFKMDARTDESGDFIEVSTISIGPSPPIIDNERELGDIKTNGELNDGEFDDLLELKDDDMDDEDFSYFSSVKTKDSDYNIQRWMVSIKNIEVPIPENKKIVIIRDDDTYLTTPSRLQIGDRILITKDFNPRSLSDFVWELMERKFNIRRKIHPGNEWREKLKQYIARNPGITYQQIFEKLKTYGKIGIKTSTSIYLWLESEDIIGPLDIATLEAIAKLVNLPGKVKEWQDGIKFIRSRHRRLIRHLWQVFKYNASELKDKSDEDYVVDPVLGIKISELSKLVAFAIVTGTPRKI